MKHKLVRWHAQITRWRFLAPGEMMALLLALLLFVEPVGAATRLQERGLYMQSSAPGVTTSYTISFRYASQQPVGSVDLLFCVDPIPDMACETPPGLSVSGATLSSQTGETGYSIGTRSANHLTLTRIPGMVMTPNSSYTLSGVVNPTDTSRAFSIRMRTHNSTDASGPLIDFGSVRGQVTNGIVIETQVPPTLVFCVAEQVEENCSNTSETYYTDMGQLSDTSTLTAQSQMAVGTNATAGFAIIAMGGTMAAGTSVIDPLDAPTESTAGKNQFGINLVANNKPNVGIDPQGPWANAIPSVAYGQANRYKYTSGDVIAYSPNVSLMRKFTVSYIVNSDKNLRAGVYSTTITYVASGRF